MCFLGFEITLSSGSLCSTRLITSMDSGSGTSDTKDLSVNETKPANKEGSSSSEEDASSRVQPIISVGLGGQSETPRVWVRWLPDEGRMRIRLHCAEYNRNGNLLLMNRRIDECLSSTLTRMISNFTKKPKCSKRKRSSNTDQQQESEDEGPTILLTNPNGYEVSPDLHNCHAWAQGNILVIKDTRYIIEVNPPSVTEMSVPSCLLSGLRIHPTLSFEFAHPKSTKYSWKRIFDDGQEERVGKRSHYTPTENDIGCKLKLEVTPGFGERLGEMVKLVSTAVVQKGPEHCPYKDRQKLLHGHYSSSR